MLRILNYITQYTSFHLATKLKFLLAGRTLENCDYLFGVRHTGEVKLIDTVENQCIFCQIFNNGTDCKTEFEEWELYSRTGLYWSRTDKVISINQYLRIVKQS